VNEFVAVSYSWQQHSDIFDDIFRPFLRSLPLISWTAIWRILINPWWKRVWGLREASTPGNDVSLISGHQRISLDIFDCIRLFLLSEDSFYSIGVGFNDGIMDGQATMVDGFEGSLRIFEIC
jgi:hypothetical protein